MLRMQLNILQRMNKKRFFILLTVGLLLFGVFIKCYYVHYTETWERQHDVIGFGADEGHAAYIEYILYNRHLPDFDPREKWAFFQPPLHHIVSAFVIYTSQKFGANINKAQENTQLATCFYMILVMLVAIWMYFKAMDKKPKAEGLSLASEGLITMLSIVGLHPIFILMSGSINNDALALILSLLSLVIAIKWYEKPGLLTTALLAICIGLGMIAKLTGGLVAVPIGILMVIKFLGLDGNVEGPFTQRFGERIKYFLSNYLLKAVVFVVIVFPLGLSFSIYNKLKWDMPLNYIPPVGENFPETVTFADRLFNIKMGSVYPCLISRGDEYDEYNVILSAIKTSLFGEYSYADVSRYMKPLTFVLFVAAVLLILVGLYVTFYMTFSKKSKLNIQLRIVLFGTWATYFLAYLYFALSSNNFSAQDFRYAAICIVCEGVFTGAYVDMISDKKQKRIITTTAVIFAVSSFMTYFLLGIKS